MAMNLQNPLQETRHNRLYIIVDKSLEPVYGCVQGGHAACQFLLEHPDSDWKNDYLIYLYGDVERLRYKLSHTDKRFSEFREPDLGDRLTSIAVEDDGRMFRNYRLVA